MFHKRIRALVSSIVKRSRMESEMSDELRFHLDTRADDLMSRHGLTREEALRRALVEFGSLDEHKDDARAAMGFRLPTRSTAVMWLGVGMER